MMASIALTAMMAILAADKHHLSLTLTFQDIDARQVGDLIPDLPVLVRNKLQGRIGNLQIIINQRGMALQASKFRIPNDPIQKIHAVYLFHSRRMDVVVHGFGGVIEVSGNLPEDIQWFDHISGAFSGKSLRRNAATDLKSSNQGRVQP